jgi:Fe-S-cluster containining protein
LSQKKKLMRAARSAAEKQRKDAQGRLHLEIYRDPASGGPRLALRRPIFEQDWQNQIATAAANTAFGAMSGEPSVVAAIELAREAMNVASGLADNFFAQLPPGTIACRAGCDHCCHQVVSITPPEALAIVEYLRKTLAQDELARVAARVSRAHEQTRGLSVSERYSSDHPCPFLESGRCSIYEARPLACRGMNSRDAKGCEKTFQDPATRAEFLANALAGYSFAEPIRAFLAISAGLQLGLSETYRLDMQPLELTAAIQLLLNGTASMAERWIAGEAPFESARAPDGRDDPRMEKLGGFLVASVE